MTIKILNKNNNNKLSILFLTIIAILNLFTASVIAGNSSDDNEYGINRIRSCVAGVPEHDFDKIIIDADLTTGVDPDQELSIDLGNTACAVKAVAGYAAFKVSIYNATKQCGVNYSFSVAPQPYNDFKAIGQCIAKLYSGSNNCRVSVAAMGVVFAGFFTEMAITKKIAQENYNNTKICGDGWVNPRNPNNITADLTGEKKTRAQTIFNDLKNGEPIDIFNNKEHREWYYDGIEVDDSPAEYDPLYLKAAATNIVKVGDAVVKPVITQISDSQSFNQDVSNFFSEYLKKKYCMDPTIESRPPQKYYMRGLMSGNFNCDKYNYKKYKTDPIYGGSFSNQRILEFKLAYDCCVNRSKNYICINYSNDNKSFNKNYFCKAGEKCQIDHGDPSAGLVIYYDIISKLNGRLICAESYSLCPYNFSVGGGTDICDQVKDGVNKDGVWKSFYSFSDIDRKKYKDLNKCNEISEARNPDCSFKNSFNKCKNYCQYLRHCTVPPKVNNSPYNSSLSSPYFPQACYDFVGDSQNGISANLYLKSVTNFTTPIVQCFRETIENIFYNRYGKSYCENSLEKPTSEGYCSSGYLTRGTSEMKMGNKVNEISFFQLLQEQMLSVVKMVLSFAVMFLGFKILLGVGSIKKPELLVFLLKISLVVYFVMGNAWQTVFFDGVYKASEVASNLVFNVVLSDNPEKRDGCQFGKVSFSDGSTELIADKTYPVNKEYLAIWDTIDCKIARYLGVSDSSMSAIGKMIAGNLLSSLLPITALINKAGIFLSFLFMIFGCILIAAAIRALHIFISSAFLIILLVYISPIIIPLCLFKRTEDIYDKWLKTLLGTAIQPIVLFAYLGIFISVLDYSVIGDGKFRGGGGNIKVLDCDEYCAKDGDIYQKRADGNWYKNGSNIPDATLQGITTECPVIEGKLYQKVQPVNNSVACIIDFANKPNAFVDWPGLSFIGLFFKTILLPTDGRFNIQLMTLAILRCIMILFVLSSFMNEIPGIGKTLLGGGLVPGGNVGSLDVAKTMFKAASFANIASNIAKSKGKDLSNYFKDKRKK